MGVTIGSSMTVSKGTWMRVVIQMDDLFVILLRHATLWMVGLSLAAQACLVIQFKL